MKKKLLYVLVMTILYSPLTLAVRKILCGTNEPAKSSDFSTKLILDLNRQGKKNIWSKSIRHRLTYCISNNFKSLKPKMLRAFQRATRDWERHANVRFIYLSEHDGKCSSRNKDVLFRVKMFNNPLSRVGASAFFPNSSRLKRQIKFNKRMVEGSSNLLKYLARHELGHVLGFRHEHIHSDNTSSCKEGGRYRYLTRYDRRSIMHYHSCNGLSSVYNLSRLDKRGARLTYP